MFNGLVDDLCDAATRYHAWWRETYPRESVYAFGFYTPPCVEWAGMVVFTEEGLRSVAHQYKDKDVDADLTIEALMDELRWSPADSPHCLENGNIFSAVNARLADISGITHAFDVEDPAFERHISALYDCLISALHQFRAGPLCGAREPLLSVWFGDQSMEEIEYFIKSCNDDEMLAWFRKTYGAGD